MVSFIKKRLPAKRTGSRSTNCLCSLNGKMSTTIISVRDVCNFDESLIAIQGGLTTKSGNVLTFYINFTVSSGVTQSNITLGTLYKQYFPAGASLPFILLDGEIPYKPSGASAWIEFGSKHLILYGGVAGKRYFVYGTWIINPQ